MPPDFSPPLSSWTEPHPWLFSVSPPLPSLPKNHPANMIIQHLSNGQIELRLSDFEKRYTITAFAALFFLPYSLSFFHWSSFFYLILPCQYRVCCQKSADLLCFSASFSIYGLYEPIVFLSIHVNMSGKLISRTWIVYFFSGPPTWSRVPWNISCPFETMLEETKWSVLCRSRES